MFLFVYMLLNIQIKDISLPKLIGFFKKIHVIKLEISEAH